MLFCLSAFNKMFHTKSMGSFWYIVLPCYKVQPFLSVFSLSLELHPSSTHQYDFLKTMGLGCKLNMEISRMDITRNLSIAINELVYVV